MKIILLVIVTALFALPTFAQDKEAAIKIFKEYSCNGCHAIKAHNVPIEERDVGEKDDQGRKPPDLSDVGKQRNADWIGRWLQKKEEIEGRTHKRMFKGSKDERDVLSAWLASLK